ncbi:MAG: sigma 54-interacting transcriptional regulator [Pirellulaceae bacterium]|nr:sigma 54-interacting transcriptional regulator [Pirellulaceae bacterium]
MTASDAIDKTPPRSADLAYLVIREGTKWTDVFRLVPGRTVTIGRAATNQIVIKDERASRNHAEVFLTRGQWTLRDLNSRNGTLVGGDCVENDYALTPGDVVRIAHCQLAFVHDINEAFSAEISLNKQTGETGDETVATTNGIPLSDSNVLDFEGQPTTITHRRGFTRFLRQSNEEGVNLHTSEAATSLCRLAFELAKQTDIETAANLALDGCFAGTRVDAGALLLAPYDLPNQPTVAELEIVASRTLSEPSYLKVSNFLATTVLREGEAVLARNVLEDSRLGSPDSKGDFHSTSVICAPVREANRILGLLHLYSTQESRVPDPDDLEFALAVADNVALALKNLHRQRELSENLSRTRTEVAQLRTRLGAESELIGSSLLMEKVQQQIDQAAPSRATVLIRGESGVGKELVARAIHCSSPRTKGPFVCMNCAALSETLLESELFGHERGAFTGATDRKLGKFEAADKGTLMLDEIGEMSPSIQAKFLRVLEGHPFERVGGSQQIKVDVRVIAATNRDLEKAVAKDSFRRDLYFRLRVVELLVPPLRKRPEDVIELASYFLERFRAETGKRVQGFTSEALEEMTGYRWPGNIRELKNVIERSVVLSRNAYIDADELQLSHLATASESGEISAPRDSYVPESLSEVERRHIARTLNAAGWNKSRSAQILGIERSTLDRKIKRYDLLPGEPSR